MVSSDCIPCQCNYKKIKKVKSETKLSNNRTMKNDVVRWSNSLQLPHEEKVIEESYQTNEKIVAAIDSASSINANEDQLGLVSNLIEDSPSLSASHQHHHHHRQSENSIGVNENGSDLFPEISLTNTVIEDRKYGNSNAFKCDKSEIIENDKNDDNFLVEIIDKKISQSRHFSNKFNCGDMQQWRSSMEKYRTVERISTLRFLWIWLQFSAVVFFCNFNIGYALGANIGTTNNEPLPYELDYGGISDNSINGQDGHYTHTWAVHIPNGDKGLADQVAKDHGFVNLGKIFDDHYHFSNHKVMKRSLTPAIEHQTRLEDDHRVHWAQQQKAKSRSKRDFIRMRPSRTSSRTFSLVDTVPFSDPKWSQMWYLNRGGGLDMNVIPAWKEGITGKGVVVTILDDGLESDHPDIEHNYDPKASYDVNSHDDNPMPHYDMTDSNRHGTRCAGEVAATANNSICAVGIAFGASVGGVRMLDGDVTDAVEARSLSLNPQHIDIYSASWGPDDDGKTVDGPGELASRAFIEGVTKGRNGKGSIFIWASGNGGRELDNCNCDGYTNSIWTLSISSATEEGHVPWYSEKCSSTLATTYSSGGQSEKQVVTTDLHHSCTVSHTGTSASAPLAAGIAALVLESNRNLTWRDLQHIVVRTAKPANLKDSTWSKNGVGRNISHSFGYGLMDAAAMVKLARKWKTVPEQQRCEINAPHVDKVIPARGSIRLQLTVKHCLSVNFLEHVQAKITLTSQRRGDIQLYLKSPAGTRVTLLTSRVHDVSRTGFNQWPFMSVHTWGESPHGNWQLEIRNEGRYMGHALLREWSLIFYGTTQSIDPNDPVSTPIDTSAEDAIINSSTASTSGNLHQVYSAQYPRISSPNNFGMLPGISVGKMPGKLPFNKSTYIITGSTNKPVNNIGMMLPDLINNKKQSSKQQQQAYQQISATYGVILGSQSKSNNKNNKSKGKSGDNNNNNKANKNSNNGNGNGNGNGKASANKKDQTPVQNTKNKFYRISQQQTNNNKPSTSKSQNGVGTQRPKMSSGEDKGNRKAVVGDISSGGISKNPQRSGSSMQTTNYAKLPVKATKQVKESMLLTGQTQLSGGTADQRIPKMFERYEKIQAIFPEFQPYQGPKEKDTSMADSGHVLMTNEKRKKMDSSNEEILKSFTGAANGAVGGGGGGGSKPSRENSKKSSPSFILDQKIAKKQQLLLAAAGVSDATERPVNMDTSGSNLASPSRKATNAQITQWELIFYGTETPAQPDDPVHLTPGSQFSSIGDMAHNDIEFDASGQWRNMQQVGESSVTSHDKTNSACIKETVDKKCLACAPPTYLFNMRCYDECPPHTYAVSNKSIIDPGELRNSNNVIDEPGEELQSMDRKRRSSEVDDMLLQSCAICDKSCLRCHGPLNSQCSTCYPGSQLRKEQHTNETYCYTFAERSSGNNQDEGNLFDHESSKSAAKGSSNLLLSAFVVIGIFLLIGIVATLIIFLERSWTEFPCSRRATEISGATASYSYDRVALLPDWDPEIDDEDDLFTAEPKLTFDSSKRDAVIHASSDDDDEATT